MARIILAIRLRRVRTSNLDHKQRARSTHFRRHCGTLAQPRLLGTGGRSDGLRLDPDHVNLGRVDVLKRVRRQSCAPECRTRLWKRGSSAGVDKDVPVVVTAHEVGEGDHVEHTHRSTSHSLSHPPRPELLYVSGQALLRSTGSGRCAFRRSGWETMSSGSELACVSDGRQEAASVKRPGGRPPSTCLFKPNRWYQFVPIKSGRGAGSGGRSLRHRSDKVVHGDVAVCDVGAENPNQARSHVPPRMLCFFKPLTYKTFLLSYIHAYITLPHFVTPNTLPSDLRARRPGRHEELSTAQMAKDSIPETTASTKGAFMGIGVSLILIAAGAILTFAVHASSSTFNIHTIGVILMVVGAIGAVTSMILVELGRLRPRPRHKHHDHRAVGDPRHATRNGRNRLRPDRNPPDHLARRADLLLRPSRLSNQML